MATIYDVARHAGVSPKTVSRVLNGDAPVKKHTREAVQSAIDTLGYVPSTAARMMRSNRSGLIGVITGAISQSAEDTNPRGLPELLILHGIQSAISRSNLTVMIADSGGRGERVPGLIRTFLQHRVEGLIYVADFHRELELPKIGIGCPLVLANCFDKHGTPSVLPDDMRGQKSLVQRLIRAGHRRIGYLTLPRDMEATRLRTEGYHAAHAEAGLSVDPKLVVSGYLDSPTQPSQLLWDAIERLMELSDPPTVLCCGNDEMAMRVYGILRTRGLRIPEDISVCGYDNYRTIAETLYPPLTTAELPYTAMGARVAETLMSLIDGQPMLSASPILVSGSVIWRGSAKDTSNLHIMNTQGRISS
ncbi:LacI family DNA-binding transcriptional regulator [Flavimaricola marinus]|uniref:Ribose operon repressor n=1 Tax=Flavimaricola marinus TaxID=1819565 RepID=A0A238LBF5_9RHOB|nr:LacI family DNA-binding transcriptional regulator [Flavimaricola marinus]SMY06250.1 Ribose operon repressor [Flavimaricola marinus]